MPTARQIAEAIVEQLNSLQPGEGDSESNPFPLAFTAERSDVPLWLLEDLSTLRVAVTPWQVVPAVVDRARTFKEIWIHVSVAARITSEQSADDLASVAGAIAEALEFATLTIADGTRVKNQGWNYVVLQDWRSFLVNNTFLSVIAFKYMSS